MNVLSNDTVSANGAPLDKTSVTVTTAPTHGTTSVNTTSGVVTYTPANGFTGTDSFDYTVSDAASPWHVHGLFGGLFGDRCAGWAVRAISAAAFTPPQLLFSLANRGPHHSVGELSTGWTDFHTHSTCQRRHGYGGAEDRPGRVTVPVTRSGEA